jgi:hypothetical protein
MLINSTVKTKTKVGGRRQERLKAMKVQNWKELAQDRNKWKGIIEQAKIHVEL